MDIININNAIYEAIYMWNRTEHYYHTYFSKFNKIIEDERIMKVFVEKMYNNFLSEYSVRRNFKEGQESVYQFLYRLKELDFFSRVSSGDINVVDETSAILKLEDITNKRRTVSLLSKTSFLINPSEFILYDNLARKSLYKKMSEFSSMRGIDLSLYSTFIKHALILLNKAESKGLFSDLEKILWEFKNTEAYSFFTNNHHSLKLRVIDKFLWIEGSKMDDKNKTPDNTNLSLFVKFRYTSEN